MYNYFCYTLSNVRAHIHPQSTDHLPHTSNHTPPTTYHASTTTHPCVHAQTNKPTHMDTHTCACKRTHFPSHMHVYSPSHARNMQAYTPMRKHACRRTHSLTHPTHHQLPTIKHTPPITHHQPHTCALMHTHTVCADTRVNTYYTYHTYNTHYRHSQNNTYLSSGCFLQSNETLLSTVLYEIFFLDTEGSDCWQLKKMQQVQYATLL